jgi:hypothetical protein
MVHAIVNVDIYTVSIQGWANNECGTTSRLPSAVCHAIPAHVPIQSRLLNRPQTPEDNVLRLSPRDFLALAALRQTNSYNP